jgi:hypothetical protein
MLLGDLVFLPGDAYGGGSFCPDPGDLFGHGGPFGFAGVPGLRGGGERLLPGGQEELGRRCLRRGPDRMLIELHGSQPRIGEPGHGLDRPIPDWTPGGPSGWARCVQGRCVEM